MTANSTHATSHTSWQTFYQEEAGLSSGDFRRQPL
jgi:hypothetical protein